MPTILRAAEWACARGAGGRWERAPAYRTRSGKMCLAPGHDETLTCLGWHVPPQVQYDPRSSRAIGGSIVYLDVLITARSGPLAQRGQARVATLLEEDAAA